MPRMLPKTDRLAMLVIWSIMPCFVSLNHQAAPCWILPRASGPWKQPIIVPIMALSAGVPE